MECRQVREQSATGDNEQRIVTRAFGCGFFGILRCDLRGPETAKFTETTLPRSRLLDSEERFYLIAFFAAEAFGPYLWSPAHSLPASLQFT